MPDFDILGPNAYGAQPVQAPQGGGFDILGPNANGQAQNGRTFNTVPVGGQQQPGQQVQPQGAPMSGLLAGILNMPRYSGGLPGATYATPGQVPGQAGQVPGAQVVQPQGSGLAAALGMGARSLFDGVVGGGQ